VGWATGLAVSRRFVAKTAVQLVHRLRLMAPLIDGVHTGEHCIVVALGIDPQTGAKHALGLWGALSLRIERKIDQLLNDRQPGSGTNGTAPTLVASAGSVWMPGSLQVDGNIAAKYQDIAEWVDSVEPLEPGTIVTIDPTGTNRVTAAARPYDSRIVGAVSPQPGLILGEPGEGRALVAQSGRVRIKADATFGAIRPGDLLVSSPTRGHAMRPKDNKVRAGTVIGKALEALPAGRGEILALLTLQ